MYSLFHSNHHEDDRAMRLADKHATSDRVVLADGSVYVVLRANLVSAKGLIAAQKAAERRVASRMHLQQELEGALEEALQQAPAATTLHALELATPAEAARSAADLSVAR